MEKFFGRRYKLAQTENFDEYMKALGVGFLLRKVGNTVTPVMEIRKEKNEYVLSSQSTFKNFTQRFTPGVQFDDVSADGRNVRTTFTINGTQLTEKQIGPDGRLTTIERYFSPEEVKVVLTIDDIVSTRLYKYIGDSS